MNTDHPLSQKIAMFFVSTFKGCIQIIFSSFFIFLCFLFANELFNNRILNYIRYIYISYPTSKTSIEKSQPLQKLVSDGVITSADNLLSNIVDHYGNVINILIFLIGFFAVFSYIQIKGNNEDKINELLDRKVNEYMENNHKFKSEVASKVEDEIEGWLDSLPNIRCDISKIDSNAKKALEQAQKYENDHQYIMALKIMIESLEKNISLVTNNCHQIKSKTCENVNEEIIVAHDQSAKSNLIE